jgi:hypothetical protein
MKYKLFFGSTAVGLFLGGGLMYLLLADEGKWGNPKYLPEFYGGTALMGVMGVAIAVLALKAYPDTKSGGKAMVGKIALVHWGTMALLTIVVLGLGSAAGLVTKANGGLIMFVVVFLDGLYTVVVDEGFEKSTTDR